MAVTNDLVTRVRDEVHILIRGSPSENLKLLPALVAELKRQGWFAQLRVLTATEMDRVVLDRAKADHH